MASTTGLIANEFVKFENLPAYQINRLTDIHYRYPNQQQMALSDTHIDRIAAESNSGAPAKSTSGFHLSKLCPGRPQFDGITNQLLADNGNGASLYASIHNFITIGCSS